MAARRLRGIPRPVLIGALIVSAGMIAAVLAVALNDDSATQGSRPPSRSSAIVTTTEAPTTSAEPSPTTAPITTTEPTTTPAAGQDRLTSESRLGYAGLGPITWGMTLDEVQAAAGTPLQLGGPECNDYGWFPALMDNGSGIWIGFDPDERRIRSLMITHPAYLTISGVHVGSTEVEVRAAYPDATAGADAYGRVTRTISDAQGRTVMFTLQDGAVVFMTAGETSEAAQTSSKCE